ncbi:hypothetical protein Hanom_Chr02g00109191 [Helianthus anomalus]
MTALLSSLLRLSLSLSLTLSLSLGPPPPLSTATTGDAAAVVYRDKGGGVTGGSLSKGRDGLLSLIREEGGVRGMCVAANVFRK